MKFFVNAGRIHRPMFPMGRPLYFPYNLSSKNVEDFDVSMAVILTSASPRWRMARALDSERSDIDGAGKVNSLIRHTRVGA